jgi:hypothetical protein
MNLKNRLKQLESKLSIKKETEEQGFVFIPAGLINELQQSGKTLEDFSREGKIEVIKGQGVIFIQGVEK